MSASFRDVDAALLSAAEVPSHVLQLEAGGVSRALRIIFVQEAIASEMRALRLHEAFTGQADPGRTAAIRELTALHRLLQAERTGRS